MGEEWVDSLSGRCRTSLGSVRARGGVSQVFCHPVNFHVTHVLENANVAPGVIAIISVFMKTTINFFFCRSSLVCGIYNVLLLMYTGVLSYISKRLTHLAKVGSTVNHVLSNFTKSV